ncbi:hypothetical protein [Nocardioides sp. WS12]|uniref:hypothetical protein n=1 Tax=Nocardioides sp. WS12 TaxID=2486272 RepID=UPI0015FDD6D9|nr:hypothetical protein [Nocardioides sp. WS12]
MGALTRAAILATFLLSLVLPAPSGADDDPGPALAGTPVAGTADPAQAPALTTGRYLDRLPATGELHYRLPRTETGTTFHVAALYVGSGNSIGEGLRLKVGTTPGDQGCGSGGVFRPTLGEPAPVLFTTVSTWTDVTDHECATADGLFLSVGAPIEAADADLAFEILVFEEPPLSSYSFDVLPTPEQRAWTPLVPAATARELPLGTTPTNAPVVRDGTFRLELRPGRTLVLAIPLDWDQSLAAQLDAVLPKGAPATDGIRVQVVGPMLGTSQVSFTDARPADWTEGTGSFRTGAQSHVVAYPNRDSYDAGINTESLAGIHYVVISWTGTAADGTAATSPEDAALSVPATVTLARSGEAQDGVPAYTELDGLIGPQAGSRLVDGTLQAPVVAARTPPKVSDDGFPVELLVAGGLAIVAALLFVLNRVHHHVKRGRHRR